jgi:hypothetical protein
LRSAFIPQEWSIVHATATPLQTDLVREQEQFLGNRQAKRIGGL